MISEVMEVPAVGDDSPTKTERLPAGSSYSVSVEIDTGVSETFEWENVQIEQSPLHIIYDGSENIIFALQEG